MTTDLALYDHDLPMRTTIQDSSNIEVRYDFYVAGPFGSAVLSAYRVGIQLPVASFAYDPEGFTWVPTAAGIHSVVPINPGDAPIYESCPYAGGLPCYLNDNVMVALSIMKQVVEDWHEFGHRAACDRLRRWLANRYRRHHEEVTERIKKGTDHGYASQRY